MSKPLLIAGNKNYTSCLPAGKAWVRAGESEREAVASGEAGA
ncbi:MAG TPA: hypothetical protein VLS47_00075 [Gallionella sp.]|nr:hypothetical protein [Gallionella sp.]